MPYVVTENCIRCKYMDCIEVCPVDCIHGPHDKTGAGAEAKVDGFIPEENDSLYHPSLELKYKNWLKAVEAIKLIKSNQEEI